MIITLVLENKYISMQYPNEWNKMNIYWIEMKCKVNDDCVKSVQVGNA